MTRELIARLNAEQCQRLHAAYTQVALVYEDLCNGPYGARQYKEYFAIMDSRENIRQRFMMLTTNTGSDGSGE